MSRCPGPHLLSCGVCGGTDAGLRARAEAAERERDEARAELALLTEERNRLRGALERAERRLTELADVETFDAEIPWPENEKPEERARAGAKDARAALAGEGEAKECWCQWEAGDSPCPTHGMDEEKGGRAALAGECGRADQ